MMIFLRRSVLILTFLGVALLMVMDVVLPRYLEKRLPAWAAESGFPGLHCEVRRVGLSGADLGQVVLGQDSDRPVLRCASVQISYTPSGLLNKTVENVHVGGLSLTLFRSEAGWQAQGLPFGAASSNGLAGENSDFQLPLHVKGVTLSASEVIFVDKASVFRLPVELQARMPTQERIDGTMVLSPFGDPVRLAAAVDLAEKSVSGRVGAARLPLRHLAALLDFPCDLLPSGRAGFEASFDVGLAPFRVRAGDGRFVLHNPHWEKAGLAWTGDDPFVVQAALEGEKVRINMTPITFEGPVSGVLDMKDAMVEITPHPRFSGLWSLELATRGMDGVRQDSPFLSGDFFGELDTSGWWRFALEGRRISRPKGVKDVRFSATEGLSLGLRGGGLVLRGEGGEGNFRIETEFDLREMTGELAGDRFRLAHLAGGGRIAGDGPQMTGGMEIRGEKISYDQRDLKSSFPSLIMTADFDGDPVAGWLGRSELKIAEAALQAAGEDFRLSGMAALLPWRYPFSSETAAGHLRIARVNHGQVGLGRIDARLRQEKEGVAWQGSWKNILAPKMDLQFDGFLKGTLSDARLDFRLERRKADLNPLLAAYAPGMSSMELRSDLRLQGRFGVNPCGLYGHTGIAVQNLSFHDREMKLQGNDVSLHLEISDIFGPRSRPAQKLSFGRIALGDVAFENGQVLFQIEPEGTLLVEKASFGWCGGKIHSESFRFRPDMEELDVVLYGDRIQLAQILEQLGAGHAEGGGALNGRIPVHYQRGKWIFDDGFLYSTPGKGGVIHVTGMENLTAGIPEDAATFGQIKLAEAALKDYEYRWARVGFNTEQEDLLITLQMDGKPSDLLPFVYRREFGGFVQAEAGFPGSNFQGIRLDLNFRFPLDQLMRYKGLLKMFN